MSAIILATLATNVAANVVSPANDFANLAPRFIGFRLGGLITGLVGVAIFPWKLYVTGYVFVWLLGTSSLLGAVGGVLIADYWLLRRTRLDVPDLYRSAGPFRYDRGRQLGGRAGRRRGRAAVRARLRRPAERRRPPQRHHRRPRSSRTSTSTPGSSPLPWPGWCTSAWRRTQ